MVQLLVLAQWGGQIWKFHFSKILTISFLVLLYATRMVKLVLDELYYLVMLLEMTLEANPLILSP